MHSKKIIGTIAFSAITAAALTACGGGGGSAGNAGAGIPTERYNITLTANPDALPTMPADPVSRARAMALGFGTHNPYYSIIHMDVRAGNNPVTPADDLNCSVDDFDVGALFDPGGENNSKAEGDGNTTGIQLYRNLTVGASAGVATLGLMAGTKAGDVRVTCTVKDPRSGLETSGSTVVHVGNRTGLPALINWVSATSTDNRLRPYELANCIDAITGLPMMPVGRTATFQLSLFDAAQQPVPDPVAANVLVQILSDSTSLGCNQGTSAGCARLDGINATNQAVQMSTINGIAQVSLTAGSNVGTIELLATADRFDNNVANGITDPVQTVYPVQVEENPVCTVPTTTP